MADTEEIRFSLPDFDYEHPQSYPCLQQALQAAREKLQALVQDMLEHNLHFPPPSLLKDVRTKGSMGSYVAAGYD
ncbi:hypothetical protein [Salinispira pacifica]|nr:hypothetical protein [Salinispira pacifica]